MFERFTNPAKRALFIARHNAWRDGSTFIGEHHLLHALTDENDPILREPLAPLDVPSDRVRSLLPPIPRTTGDPRDREIPFSEAMKQVLTLANGPLTQSGVRIEAARIAVRETV